MRVELDQLDPSVTDCPDRPQWWPLTLSLAGTWSVLVAVQYFQMEILSYLWILAIPVIYGAWLIPFAATVAVLPWVWRWARWLGLAELAVITTALAAIVASVNWWHVNAVTYYYIHRGEFLTVGQLTQDREWLSTAPSGYYGPQLPLAYAHLSMQGSLAEVGTNNHEHAYLLARGAFIPDGAVGYVHLVGEPEPGLTLDGYGIPIKPTIALGDGWWWCQ
ncbi:hypothetical protein [Actinokineospora enzanensis]|uniref:hypothetical protein n=1 Tax=Actinokineospora enzanensis TaxID=155975 RepID=UPI00035F9014|nr:hypothetical protein [Actinokineospora enzanensis]